METLNMPEKKGKIMWDYDDEADVLYISFGDPKDAEGIDIGEGTIIRVKPGSNIISGVTIINPLGRTLSILGKKQPSARKNKLQANSK